MSSSELFKSGLNISFSWAQIIVGLVEILDISFQILYLFPQVFILVFQFHVGIFQGLGILVSSLIGSLQNIVSIVTIINIFGKLVLFGG